MFKGIKNCKENCLIADGDTHTHKKKKQVITNSSSMVKKDYVQMAPPRKTTIKRSVNGTQIRTFKDME